MGGDIEAGSLKPFANAAPLLVFLGIFNKDAVVTEHFLKELDIIVFSVDKARFTLLLDEKDLRAVKHSIFCGRVLIRTVRAVLCWSDRL